MASRSDAQGSPEGHSRLEESEKHDRYQSSVLNAVGDHAQVIDPEIEARVVRKIDLFLMPAMVIGYGLVYYDKIKEAVLDPKVWLVALTMASGYTVNGAVSGFGPLIVSTFGYSALDSILFQFPLGAICAVGIPLTGCLCSKYRNIRIITLIVCTLPVIAGFVTIWKSDWGVRPVAPVVGYSLIGFFGPVVSLTVTLGAGNVAGETKKSFMASAVFVAYCVGNIVGPQLVRSETKAQHYPELWTGLIICYCITIVSASALYVLLWKENKRRDSLDLDESERDRFAFKDLTDKENLHFRYVL
ncbi:hypothetical protein K4K55_000184 [Colletotrichum sp. SAR 10_96]|nr:hypothetical protein K4K55_000184 [Colletotrichum sp. SAR 10_96]